VTSRPIPPPGAPAALGFPADLLAEADCLRQLARLQPSGCFLLPYLRGPSFVYDSRLLRIRETLYDARLLQFRDVAEGIYYDDSVLYAEANWKKAEESARRYLPPGMDRVIESEYVFGWIKPQEAYPLVVRHLLDSGFLDRRPELRERAEAALTLGGLL